MVPHFTLQVCVRPGDLDYRQAVPAGPRLPGQPCPGACEYEASAEQGSQVPSLGPGEEASLAGVQWLLILPPALPLPLS